ncbi:MAG: aminoacyl-tRNA hydrolase [Spirochaetales bacterium]|nr:aminoacyl-tRNA hydrolase [Spirochaetales bacterium]
MKKLKKQQKVLKNNKDLMIIGLGNPGPRYKQTRHNVGFDFVELLAGQLNLFLKKPLFKNYLYTSTFLADRRIHLVEPLTFMNRSGMILPSLMKKYSLQPEDVMIVTDNMDLPPGRCRMKPGGSSAGHNGLKSVIHYLDTKKFYRLYVGVGRPGDGETVVDHVLGQFSEKDYNLVKEALQQAADTLTAGAGGPLEQILNAVNSRKG